MKRFALLFLFACNSTSTTPPTPAPTTTASAPASSASAAAPTSCTKDGDCALMSSYCGDLPCACVPYLKSAGEPKCNAPNTVQCFVAPCMTKSVACQEGKCVVTPGGAKQ